MGGIEIVLQPARLTAASQLVENGEWIHAVQMQTSANDVHFAASDEDPIVIVLDFAGKSLQVVQRKFYDAWIAEHHQPRLQMLGQYAMSDRVMNESSGKVALPHAGAGPVNDLGRKDGTNSK